jgi:hypothetical protein
MTVMLTSGQPEAFAAAEAGRHFVAGELIFVRGKPAAPTRRAIRWPQSQKRSPKPTTPMLSILVCAKEAPCLVGYVEAYLAGGGRLRSKVNVQGAPQ